VTNKQTEMESWEAEILKELKLRLPKLAYALNSSIWFVAKSIGSKEFEVSYADSAEGKEFKQALENKKIAISGVGGKNVFLRMLKAKTYDDKIDAPAYVFGDTLERLGDLRSCCNGKIQSMLINKLNVKVGVNEEEFIVAVGNAPENPQMGGLHYTDKDFFLLHSALSSLESGLEIDTRIRLRKRWDESEKDGLRNSIHEASKELLERWDSIFGDEERDLKDHVLASYIDMCTSLSSHPLEKKEKDEDERMDELDRAIELSKLFKCNIKSLFLSQNGGANTCTKVYIDGKKITPIAICSSMTETHAAILRALFWLGRISKKYEAKLESDFQVLEMKLQDKENKEIGDEEREEIKNKQKDIDRLQKTGLTPNEILEKDKLPPQFVDLLYKKLDDQLSDSNIAILRSLWNAVYWYARMAMDWPSLNKLECRQKFATVLKLRGPTVKLLKQYFLEQQGKHAEENCAAINMDLLGIWFTIKVLGTDNLLSYYHLTADEESAIASQSDTMRFMLALSTSVLYWLHIIQYRDSERQPILADVEGDGRFEVLNAHIHLLSEYAHVELGVMRELRLAEHLRSLFQMELLLYGTSEGYRDHLFHAMDVCLLGSFLFDCKMKVDGEEKSLCSAFSKYPPFGGDEKMFLANWYVSCLFHDFGYALSLPDSIVSSLKDKFVSPYLKEFVEKLEGVIDDGQSHINRELKTSLNFSQENMPKNGDLDHGLSSWLELREILKLTKRGRKIIRQFEPALKAVLSHNKPAKKINANREPLAFFLFLCDRLQEWGRPRVNPESFAQSFAATIRYRGRMELRLNPGSRKIQIKTANEVGEDLKIVLPDDIPHFVVDYDMPELWTFEPAITWVTNVYDFQFISCPKAWEDMKITMRSPMSSFLRDIPWQPTEMELLQNFAREESTGYLEQWIEMAKRKDGCIQYERIGKGDESDTDHEEVTIKLKGLSERKEKLIPALSKKLFLEFQDWKQLYLLSTHSTLSVWETSPKKSKSR